MRKNLFVYLLSFALAAVSFAQKKSLPVIDMHLHADYVKEKKGRPSPRIGAPFRDFGVHDLQDNDAEKFLTAPSTNDSLRMLTLAALRKHNVYGVTSGDLETVLRWKQEAPDRIIPALYWDFNSAKQRGLTVDSLEQLFRSGVVKVFGEITIQYEGFSASDSAFEPYLALAEKLDIPVGIHIGCGPPGAPYLGSPRYRATLHSPLLLEEALIKHPKLRVYAMHAGWPMLDDMLAMMYTHPQLYVDVAAICYMIPRREFYTYLQRIVQAGFGKRVLFGSDNMIWPDAIEAGIQSIQQAKFLTEKQKRDILFNNAARFLRLTDRELKAMY